MEVTGRDRVHFFRRPILPNTMPLPYIRYAREISQDVADIKRRDRLKEDGHGKHVTINEPTSPTKVKKYPSPSYNYDVVYNIVSIFENFKQCLMIDLGPTIQKVATESKKSKEVGPS